MPRNLFPFKICVLVSFLFCSIVSFSQAPVITSFTPISATPGASVTLTGTGFNATAANNIVFFGATSATVTAASATSITVTVPTGATYAPITLLNTGTILTCASLSNFNPIYSPAKANFGSGDLSAKLDSATGTNPHYVAIGDLDGDGKPDLAVANFGSATVSIFRNTSSSGSIAACSFEAKVDFATGSQPRSVAIGDLDGDGKPDLAVANYNSTSVSVLRNTSSSGSITAASFATKVDFGAGCGPIAVAIGDLDGDGKPDLAVTNYCNINVSVFRNTSSSGSITTGSFATKVDFTTGANPRSIAISDLDGDGKPDLAVANLSSGNVSVFRNTSSSGSITTGSFAAKVDFSTGSGPTSLAVGDLDGDGKPDLAMANNNNAYFSVLRNTSSSGSIVAGSFATKVDFTTGSSPFYLAIGDLDGDGKPDLAVTSYGISTVSVFRNTSSSGSIVTGSFAAKVDFTTGTGPYSVAIGDLNGDGKPDLVVANATSNTVSVIRNADCTNPSSGGTIAAAQSGGIGFDPVPFTSSSASTGYSGTLEYKWQSSTTSNSLGFSDIASSNSETYDAAVLTQTTWFKRLARVSCKSDWTGAAESNVLEVTVYPPPVITSFTPISAIPGASVTITGTYFSTTAANNIVFFGATKAIVTAATATSVIVTVPIGATYGPITLLNADVVLACASLNNFVPIYSPAKAGISTTTFSPKVDSSLGVNPLVVAIGDLDGDGKSDLAVCNLGSNNVSVLRNTSSSGSISFATKVDFTTGTQPAFIAIGDLNGDGKPDLAVANYNNSSSGNSVSILRNTSTNGTVSFAAKVDFTTGTNPHFLAIGDIDVDGKSDIAVSNYGSNTISILRNTSTGGTVSFATKVDFSSGANPLGIAIGDLDNDRKLDLAVVNYSANTVSVFRNTSSSGTISTSSFAAKVDFATGVNPYHIAIGDLDGDDKPEIVNVNAYQFTGGNSFSVLRNTSTSGTITTSSFATKVDFASGTNPSFVSISDVNGDNKPDIAVVNTGSTTVSVFRNTSTNGIINTSSFAAKVDFTTGSSPKSVAIGDIDNDLKSDLAVVNYSADNTVSIFRNADCINPTSGGTIADAQSGSSGFNPAAFTSTAAPTGHTGTLEYKWQSSVTSSSAGFSDIASSNSAIYDASALTQTTWFKRLAKVDCLSDWSGAAESNVLQICITPSTPTVNVVNNCDGSSTLSTTASGSLLWSTTETTSSITVRSAGTYTVTQTVIGCSSASAAGSGVAAPKTAPTANITNNTASTLLTCSRTAISVTASGGVSYLWSEGLGSSANASITVPGTYTVTVTGSNSCTSTASITATQNIVVPPAPSGTGGIRCSTGTVSISATPGSGETIDWYAASSGGSVMTSGSGVTSFTTPSISTTTIYYAEARNTTTGCISATRTAVTATVDAQVTASNAGSDQALCNNATLTLAGNAPSSGTGVWTLVSGTSTITSPSSATTTITAVPTNTNITLRWTITNGTCSSTDDVVIRNDASVTVSNAGSDQALCNTSTFTLNGNSPSSGIGVWSFVGSSGSTSITNNSLLTSTVTSVPSSTDITLRWTVTNGTCSSTDDVVIRNNPLPDATISASGATTFTYGNSVVLSGPQVVPVSEGNALSLNGTSNYVSIPFGINSNFSGNQITVEGWFYPTQSFPATVLIGEAFEGDGVIKFALYSNYVGGTQKIIAGFYSNNWVQPQSSTDLPFNQWTHIAATYDQTNIKIYVNGVLTCTQANTNALPNGSERWILGKCWDCGNYFPGKMDEIRIWNVARTQAQIQTSMNSSISPTTSGLVGYYKMDEASGNSASDATGHGYTGTVN